MAARTCSQGLAAVVVIAAASLAQVPAAGPKPAERIEPGLAAPAPPGADAGAAVGRAAAAARNVWTSLEPMLGLEVAVVEPAAHGAVDASAARMGGEATDAAPHTAPTAADAQPTARIEELFVDCASGRIEWVVLATQRAGGASRLVLVPFSALTSSAVGGKQPPRFTLVQARERWLALPSFDARDADPARRTAAVARHAREWQQHEAVSPADAVQPVEASARTREVSAPAVAGAPELQLVAARELLGLRARTGVENQAFGRVKLALAEPRRGTIDFLVISRGGFFGIGATEYLVPYGATSLARVPRDGRWRLQLDRGKARMTGAVKYEPGADGDGWLEPSNAHRAREFFGAAADPVDSPVTPSAGSGVK